ncbi:MAG: hypothetical protein FH748_02320 [Balneolaceae bacterium]|nr:hypothetical protein [Balneolaceae bacterium]
MKRITFICLFIVTSVFVSASLNKTTAEIEDLYMISCLDGVTGESKIACVDWQATIVPCSPESYPCADIIVE